jgi:hypothetical protein
VAYLFLVRPRKHTVKLGIGLTVGLLAGLVLGWYFGYTRPVAKANRDARRYLTTMEHDDRMTAVVALTAIHRMEEGRSAEAKELLAQQLGSYYVVYGPPDNPKKHISAERMQVLRKIEEAARNYPVVQAAVEKAKQNVR